MTRLLIVEDDPEQARALQRAFAKLRPDLTLLTASDGLAATELLKERAVDVVLSDLQMPQMDGFELIAWLHNHCPEVHVFTMSAFGSVETAAQLANLGAIEHFPKPVDEKLLMSRLNETLSQSVRGHVQNVSLASFLQLLEMERKSCTLTVTCDGRTGVLVVRRGALISATTAELDGEAAAIAIVAWPAPTIAISRQNELVPITISASLGFIVMEAMRLQDEASRLNGHAESNSSVWPAPRRTWRPTGAPSEFSFASSRPPPCDLGLPGGAHALALVETATGNVLRAAAHDDCPVGELARLAAQLLLQEAATLRLCSDTEGVEELVLSTSSRCDVIRPLSASQFALLVFAPEDTNLVMARIELEHFIAVYAPSGPQRTP